MDANTTHEIVTSLSPTALGLIVFGAVIGVPLTTRLLDFLSNLFKSKDASEAALISRLLDIIDDKFDKLADSILKLAEETRENRILYSKTDLDRRAENEAFKGPDKRHVAKPVR